MRAFVLLLMVWLGVLAPSPAQAWSAFGHRLVALLAQDQLSAETRAQVDALLAEEPGSDMGTIAAWADEVRRQPGYEHTGPYHYVNFPEHSCHYLPARDCPGGNCVIAALDKYNRVLGDRSRPAKERLEALKFVVHFVGDMHQPLHAGNRDDRGGNRFQVRVGDEGSNLHSVWDYHVLKSGNMNMSQYRQRLASKVAALPVPEMDFAGWAESSCELIDRVGLYPPKPGKLPKDYLSTMRPHAENQIVLAASRLAGLLEITLGEPGAGASDIPDNHARSASLLDRVADFLLGLLDD